MPRVCMLGLDCLAPDLLFSRFWQDLPNLRALADDGAVGPLRSCHPPITVPAWATMLTGVDPGALGVYGFHDRADRSYHKRRLASSLSYHQPPLWNILSQAGRTSRVIAIPQTYPPQPLNGYMVTGCLTPTHLHVATYPPHIRSDVLRELHGGCVDVPEFRGLEPALLLEQIQRNSRSLFALAEDWVQRPDWDFFAMVDMGADRLHHALWRYCMNDHPEYVPNHALRHALRDYYRQLDEHIGSMMQLLRPDDVLLVVSDHGAQAMHGAIAVNQWLLNQGFLVLRNAPPRTPTAFNPNAVDWPRTRAWADGGYTARIYLNVRGREPEGCVEPTDVDATLQALESALHAVPGPPGARQHRALRPQAIYTEVRGIAPDLLVYWGNLKLRALASLGHPEIFVQHNDRGPDGANHSLDGVFMLRDGRGPRPARHYSIYEVAPLILRYLGLPAS